MEGAGMVDDAWETADTFVLPPVAAELGFVVAEDVTTCCASLATSKNLPDLNFL